MRFYPIDGKPYNAKITEARKLKLLPSITEVLKIESNYGLELYKIKSALMGALTLTRFYNEDDESFIARVLADGKKHSRRAAKIGNIIHLLISRYINNKPIFYLGNVPEIKSIWDVAKKWIDDFIDKTDSMTEKILYSETIGMAGTCDFIGKFTSGERVIIDWKTQDVKHPGFSKRTGDKLKDKVNFYDSWCCQLVGYNAMASENQWHINDELVSVVFGTNPENHGVWVRYWSEEEKLKAWKKLLALRDVFYINNKLEL